MDPTLFIAQIAQSYALIFGIAVLCGINLYSVVLMLALGSTLGAFALPQGLELLTHPAVLTAAVVLYAVDLMSEKFPSFDGRWDLLQGTIRVLGGALIAEALLWPHEPWQGALIAGLAAVVAGLAHLVGRCWRRLLPTQHAKKLSFTLAVFEGAAVGLGTWLALAHATWFLPFALGVLGLIGVCLFLFRDTFKQVTVQIKQQCTPSRSKAKVAPQAHVEPASRALSKTEVISALERLYKLRTAGALSMKEFERHKQALLSQ